MNREPRVLKAAQRCPGGRESSSLAVTAVSSSRNRNAAQCQLWKFANNRDLAALTQKVTQAWARFRLPFGPESVIRYRGMLREYEPILCGQLGRMSMLQCYGTPSYKHNLLHAHHVGEAPASLFAQVGLELVQEIL